MESVSPANNPNYSEWYILANAIDTVSDLPFDDKFVETMRKNAVQFETVFNQGDAAICLDNCSYFTASELTKYSSERHLVVSGTSPMITMVNGSYTIDGEVVINGIPKYFYSENEVVYLQESNMPSVPIEPTEITNFFLAIAGTMIDENPDDVEELLIASQKQSSPWDALAMTISKMGNLFGGSRQTMRSLFEGDSASILAELTISEYPDGNDMANCLLLEQVLPGQRIDESLLTHDQRVQDQNYREVSRVGYIATARSGAAGHPARIALLNEPVHIDITEAEVHPYNRSDPKPEHTVAYAKLCQNFLEMYKQLT